MSKKDYRKSNPGTHGLGFSWNVLRTCIVILLFVAGIVAATQDFSYAMNGDQRVVNTPLFKLGEWWIYNPVFFILSFFKYFGYEGLHIFFCSQEQPFLSQLYGQSRQQ